MKQAVLHMIGNAHIDPVWLWHWPEGFQEVLGTFRSALDRMRQVEDFRFTASSAAFYAWVEQIDPAMFEEIRARVREGRWEIVGGWWIEADCNIPSGESFVRQALFGQRYFRARFGTTARVGYSPDSFGHHGMLPQILKKSGLDYYVFLRPSPQEKDLPGRLLWWEADDGSRVLALRIPFEYCTQGDLLEEHVRRCAAEMAAPLDEFTCFYGVGNHGGGPTLQNIEGIRRLDDDPALPSLVFSTAGHFFEAAQAKGWPLSVVHGDLQHHASGCYAAHSGIKRWNRQAENALLRAEKWGVIANWVTGQPYPPDLSVAWKGVLFNQFHDILAGTCLEAAYDDAQHLYGEAMAIAGRGLHAATQSLAWNLQIAPEEGTQPIVVFNPHAWALRTPVEAELGDLAGGEGLMDDHGHFVPLQWVQSQATTNWRRRASFVAELPPLGYRLYRLTANGPQLSDTPLGADATQLENDRFRLTFDPRTGYLTSLYDHQHRVEVLAGPAAKPVVLHDEGDTWGHNLLRFGAEVGTFVARRMRLVEHGPVKAVLRVESVYGASRLVQDFTLYRDLARIDVHVTVDWREQFKALKLQFPVRVKHAQATYEIPYGHIVRIPNGEEEPMQGWVDLSGISSDGGLPYGLSLLNDGKYSAAVNEHTIALTVLRSPISAHHIPAQPEPERDYSFLDQGVQHFTYALLPHHIGWQQAGTVRQAAALNQAAVVLVAACRTGGSLPLTDSFLTVDGDNILVTTLKKAEDNDDLILRAYETTGNTTRAILCLPRWGRVIETTFGACEIKTFRVPRDPQQPVVETDLLEDPQGGG
jgi:alpha-mannosidase